MLFIEMLGNERLDIRSFGEFGVLSLLLLL